MARVLVICATVWLTALVLALAYVSAAYLSH